MQKIADMLLSRVLFRSYADDKPHFLPASGGTAESGGNQHDRYLINPDPAYPYRIKINES